MVSFFVQFSHAQNSCECPKLACDPCSVERGITFFSDKCQEKKPDGSTLAKVKSCARPTCVPIEEATKECPTPPQANSGPREPIVVGKTEPVKVEAAVGANELPTAGKVKVLQGSVSIVRADGQKSVVSKEAALMEGDVIESGSESGAVVNFHGGNKLHVQPDTKVEIKEFKDQQSPDSRKALLNLIKGKIRNQVEQKYNGKTSYYKVMTKGAVAGVRGTDFVIEHRENEKLETRVETFHGKVILSDLEERESVDISKGEGAVYTAIAGEFVQKGLMSDVYKISPDKLAILDKDTRWDTPRSARKAAKSSDPEICDKPKAAFNKCNWKCENNPKGAKVCRTDMPGVRCVRQRCNGNGTWAEETRLPASTGQAMCPPSGATVKDCDY